MDEKSKKGFSGLSDLTSDITSIDEPIISEPKTETEKFSDKQSSPNQSEITHADDSVQQPSTSQSSIKKGDKEERGGGSGGKWIIGIIGFLLVIWFFNERSDNPSYNSSSQDYNSMQNTPSTEIPTSSKVKNSVLQYTKPTSIGTDNVLSIPEIRWCIRESIRIKTMKDIIDISGSIDEFNRNVDDYNSYCGSYRYRQGSQQSAERDVESYRSQIVAEAVQQAKQLGQPSLSSYPLSSSNDSISNTPSVAIPPPIQPPSPFQDSLQQDNPLGEGNDSFMDVAATPLELTPITDINEKFKVVVKTEQANIRMQPKKQENILGIVMQGQQLSVINKSGDYFLIATSAGNGFIHNSVVQALDGSNLSLSKKKDDSQSSQIIISQNKAPPEVKYPMVTSVNSTKEKFKVIVKAIEANLRKSPQKTDNILGIVKQGERLSVIDIIGDYYLVGTSSGNVFIHNSAVQQESKENNKPNNDANISDGDVTINNLPYEDQSAIQTACVHAHVQGAAAYRKCVKQQVDQLKGTPPVSIDNLPYEDRSAIQTACAHAHVQGAAAYRKCLNNQVDQLR